MPGLRVGPRAEVGTRCPGRWQAGSTRTCASLNVTARGYRVRMDDLLPDVPRPVVRYQVKVTLVRAAEGCDPGEDRMLAELAASALSAEGLLGVWSATQTVLSLLLDAEDDASALAAGNAVVRALGGARGASVSVERARGGVPVG